MIYEEQNKIMKKYLTIISIILLITPATALAAPPSNLTGLMRLFIELLDQAVVVVGALALLFFFWGLSQLLLNADNEDKKKTSKSIMVWGIIILFVMFSIGGILRILDNTFFGGSGSSGSGTNKTLDAYNRALFDDSRRSKSDFDKLREASVKPYNLKSSSEESKSNAEEAEN